MYININLRVKIIVAINCILTTVYSKTFEGENFRGFRGF